MNRQRKFYEEKARDLILEIRRNREAEGLTYDDLARRLEAYGAVLSRKALTNKLHRGRYSFEFALQVLAALGVTSLRIPQLPRELQRPDPGADSRPDDE